MDEELREQISDILDDFGHEVVNQAYDSRFSLIGKHEYKLLQLIKARDAAKEREVRENELTLALKDSPNSGLYATYYENRVKMIRTSDQAKEEL